MEELLNILSEYSKEAHTENLYSKIEKIDFKIQSLYSSNWQDQTWLTTNEVPYIALTNLMDSYYCLPERPDMAFTHIWKSINNTYLKIGKKDRIKSNDTRKLNDSDGITYLVKAIERVKNDKVTPTVTIMQLISNYIDIIPIKSLKFIGNYILKGYAIDQAGINPILNSSSYFSFRKNHLILHNEIASTYGKAYKAITSPTVSIDKVVLNIFDKQKAKKIPESLAEKLQDLMRKRSTTITDSSKLNPITLSLVNDEEFLNIIIRIILYSVRNNSIHGNLVSRLNSEYVNTDSLKNSNYIYFLAHLILSIGMYINGEIKLNELDVNLKNLVELKKIIL